MDYLIEIEFEFETHEIIDFLSQNHKISIVEALWKVKECDKVMKI